MARDAAPDRGTDRDILSDVASPWLYQRNAFRLTGLAIGSSGRDIRRMADQLAIIERVGGATPTPPALAVRPAPTTADLYTALDRLRDSRERLVDEFFWFWPAQLGATDDEALVAMAAGDPDSAATHWSASTGSTGSTGSTDDSGTGAHNLAVLEHLRALDAELAPGNAQAVGQPDWAQVYRRWADVLRDGRIWDRLAAQIRRTADARLDESLAAGMRSALPGVILSIGAELAATAIRGGDRERARMQLAALRQSRLGNVEAALRSASQPMTTRISTLCTAMIQAAVGTPSDGIDHAERLLADSEGILGELDFLLPDDEPVRVHAHDEVALAALRCVLAFDQRRAGAALDVGDAKAYQRMAAVVEQARRIAVSASAQDRLAENSRILVTVTTYLADKIRVTSTTDLGSKTRVTAISADLRSKIRATAATTNRICWTCKKEPADPQAPLKVGIHNDVKRQHYDGGSIVRWRKQMVNVPRCATCRRRDERKSRFRFLRRLLYFVIASVVIRLTGGTVAGMLFLGIVLGLVAIGVDVGVVTQREWMRVKSFPPMANLVKVGWRRGERPGGING